MHLATTVLAVMTLIALQFNGCLIRWFATTIFSQSSAQQSPPPQRRACVGSQVQGHPSMWDVAKFMHVNAGTAGRRGGLHAGSRTGYMGQYNTTPS